MGAIDSVSSFHHAKKNDAALVPFLLEYIRIHPNGVYLMSNQAGFAFMDFVFCLFLSILFLELAYSNMQMMQKAFIQCIHEI